MSKRVLAPVMLLLAAAASMAAVFAVHRIEARGGPLSEPYATQFFAPGSNGAKGTATIRFTAREPHRASIDVRRCDGDAVVRRLVDDRKVRGAELFRWDGLDDRGRQVRDGCYELVIRLAGDPRTYLAARPTWVDTIPPVAEVDRSAIKDGTWNGLIFTEPGVRLEYRTPEGELLDADALEARIFKARVGHSSGTAKVIDPPDGATPYRFTVRVDEHPELLVTAVDLAGNSTALPTDLIARAEVVER